MKSIRLLSLVACVLPLACKGSSPEPQTKAGKSDPAELGPEKAEPEKTDPTKTEPAKPDPGPLEPPPINPVVTNCNITPPDTPITTALLSSGLPCAVTVIKPITLDNLQHAFDYHSWLVFLALNAPISGGVIGSGKEPGGDAVTVWEGYKNLADIMLPGGAKPAPWDAPPVIPEVCKSAASTGRVLRMVGKTPDLLNEFDQPFDTGPLIDQQGQYVRYEILVNKPMFEYIVQNNLYSKAGQAAFSDPIVFPEGEVTEGTTGTIGAFMIKAAWKLMDGDDDPTKFHTTKALIYTPPSENPPVAESCSEATVGLVGLHVVQKTQVEPQWVWSTFEHVANAPTQADVDAKKLAAVYNFFDPDCDKTKCPVNEPPPRPWDPNVVPFPGGYHTQVVRETAITDEVATLDTGFQGILPNTVWANYMLISTQWPTDGTSTTDPNGVPAPTFLANTTMETYVQGATPKSSSSCIDCHGDATATSGRPSDFTYILERAQ